MHTQIHQGRRHGGRDGQAVGAHAGNRCTERWYHIDAVSEADEDQETHRESYVAEEAAVLV